jgi:hypothetical protein
MSFGELVVTEHANALLQLPVFAVVLPYLAAASNTALVPVLHTSRAFLLVVYLTPRSNALICGVMGTPGLLILAVAVVTAIAVVVVALGQSSSSLVRLVLDDCTHISSDVNVLLVFERV